MLKFLSIVILCIASVFTFIMVYPLCLVNFVFPFRESERWNLKDLYFFLF